MGWIFPAKGENPNAVRLWTADLARERSGGDGLWYRGIEPRSSPARRNTRAILGQRPGLKRKTLKRLIGRDPALPDEPSRIPVISRQPPWGEARYSELDDRSPPFRRFRQIV